MPGRVFSVSFGNVEKRYAFAAWLPQKQHLKPGWVPSVRFGRVEKRHALASAWLPQLAAWLPQGAAEHWRLGKVPSVSFGNVEKRSALAAWLPKRREGFDARQGIGKKSNVPHLRWSQAPPCLGKC